MKIIELLDASHPLDSLLLIDTTIRNTRLQAQWSDIMRYGILRRVFFKLVVLFFLALQRRLKRSIAAGASPREAFRYVTDVYQMIDAKLGAGRGGGFDYLFKHHVDEILAAESKVVKDSPSPSTRAEVAGLPEFLSALHTFLSRRE